MNLIDAMLAITNGDTVRLGWWIFREKPGSGVGVFEMKRYGGTWGNFNLTQEQINSEYWSVDSDEKETPKKQCDCECMENIKGFASVLSGVLAGIDGISADSYDYFRRELELLGLVD